MARRLILPIGDDHFAALGRIAVYLEYLHLKVQFWTWELMGCDQRIGQVVTAGVSFKRSLNTLGALAVETLAPEQVSALKELLNRADRLEDRRNTVLHSVWLAGTPPFRSKTTASRKRIRFDNEPLDVKALHAVADEIEAVALALQDLLFGTPGPGDGANKI